MTARGGHERLFRALLRLYPASFRRAHGHEMAELFGERLKRCESTADRARLWWRVGTDMATNGLALRRRGLHGDWKGEGMGGMGTLVHDIRHAARHLLRSPLFTLSAIALLAVGIGANVAVFSLVDALLLRPPPYSEPERVVAVYQDSDDGDVGSNAFPAYRDMAESSVFAAVAATSPGQATLESGDGSVPVSIEFTTASYLEVLGLEPSRGRWFSSEHDAVGTAPVAVVSYPAWRARFGADPSIVGRTLRMNGQSVTVIGVGPEKLSGTAPGVVTDLWLSISATPVGGAYRVTNLDRREDHWYEVRARLAAGIGIEQARSAMDALAARMAELYPELDRGRGIRVYAARDVRIHPGEDASVAAGAWLLMGIVGLVLVLACGNLANLLLVRGLGRSGEVALRRAIGASAGRVARLFLAESLLLSVIGGAAGAGLAAWAISLMAQLPLPYPLSATLDLGVDVRVLLFCGGLTLATGVLFGLAPAVRSIRADVAGTLRDDARTSSPGRGVRRLRNVLVGLQVAVSLVLVLGAGLLVRSLSALQNVDTGVDADRIAYLRTDLAQAGFESEEIGVALNSIDERLSGLPGVTAVAMTSRLPAQGSGSTTTVVEGYSPASGTEAMELAFAVVSPSYFQTMGLRMVQGPGFGPDDLRGTQTAVVVNETAARRFWPDVDPLTGRIRPQGAPDAWRRIVGVVEDAPVSGLGEAPRPMFYYTSGQVTLSSPWIVVRTDGDPAALLPAMRAELGAFRASLPMGAQGTLADHFGASLAGQRFATAGMGAFSLLALVLASLGIYAVVAFSVARRGPELGVRIALGADRARVVRTVVGEVVATVVVGILVGVALAAVVAPRLQGVLYGVEPVDPVTFGGGVLLLLVVSAVAAWLPARRAAGLDPVESLRA